MGERRGLGLRTLDAAQTAPMHQTRFADEVTRRSYQLTLEDMDTQVGDAGLTAVVTLQTSGDVTMEATKSGPEGIDNVRRAARRAGRKHAMATDWLRQLGRITRGVKRGTTVYSGTNLTVTTASGTPTPAASNGSTRKPSPSM